MTDSASSLSGKWDDAATDRSQLAEPDDAASMPQPTVLPSLRTSFVVLCFLSAIVLAYVAPLSLSMPFAAVALVAPLLATCDCRHSRVKASESSSSSKHVKQSVATAADGLKEETAVGEAEEPRSEDRWQGEERHGSINGGLSNTLQSAAQASSSVRSSSSSGDTRLDQDSAGNSSELSLIRSEERLTVRKERVITSRLVVRKVVTTEMVIMSVPVRKERLEVETVYVEEPLVHDADDEDAPHSQTATQGYVQFLPSPQAALSEADAVVYSKTYTGDRHNYVGVNEAGQEVLELLLCEERPRVEMDVTAVSRVYVTKVPTASSQLVKMDLRKEHIEYVAPHMTSRSSEQRGLPSSEVKVEWG